MGFKRPAIDAGAFGGANFNGSYVFWASAIVPEVRWPAARRIKWPLFVYGIKRSLVEMRADGEAVSV